MLKKEKNGIWKGCGLLLGLALMAGGCADGGQEPIVAPKTQTAPWDEAEGSRPEAEKNDLVLPFSEQAAAPKQYQPQLNEDWLTLDGKASIIMPETEKIFSVTVGNPGYSEEDRERLMAALEKAAGKKWSRQELSEETEKKHLTVNSQDNIMELTFMSGKLAGQTPMFWERNLVYSRGADDSFDPSDLSGLQMEETERQAMEEVIKEKAEELMKDMGLEEFYCRQSEWRGLRRYQGDGLRELEENGDYGLWLRYLGSYAGVPVAGLGSLGVMGEIPSWNPQYVELLYSQAGELLEVKNIGLDRYGAEKQEEFFLPFASVAELFEQYCRTFYTGERVRELLGTAFPSDNEAARCHITVEEVRLEYRPVALEKEAGKEERTRSGRLVPVWNFYGKTGWIFGQEIPGEGSTVSASRQLLLAVNACDGQVYGK